MNGSNVHQYALEKYSGLLNVTAENLPRSMFPNSINMHFDNYGARLLIIWNNVGRIEVNVDVHTTVTARVVLNGSWPIVSNGTVITRLEDSGIPFVQDYVMHEMHPVAVE